MPIFLFLLLFASHLSGQTDVRPVDRSRNFVIAPSGLNVRATPRLDAKKIGGLAFGERVKIIGDTYFGFDTIAIIPGFRRWYLYETKRGETIEGTGGSYLVAGNWVQIDFRGEVGYVVDTYLHRGSPPATCAVDTDAPNDDYLFTDGYGTYAYMDFRADCYHWYGIAAKDGRFMRYSIQPDFVVAYSEMSGAEILLIPDERRAYIYYFGTKKPVREGEFFGDFLSLDTLYSGHERANNHPAHRDILNRNGIQNDTSSFSPFDQRRFYLEIDNAEFTLAPLDTTLVGRPMALHFAGDINADGAKDYVMEFWGKGDNRRTMLFLGTPTKGRRALRVVAYYDVYYD